jgi:hypothetical protein
MSRPRSSEQFVSLTQEGSVVQVNGSVFRSDTPYTQMYNTILATVLQSSVLSSFRPNKALL